MNKITKKMVFSAIADYARTTGATFGEISADEVITAMEHEISLLSRKSTSRKVTEKQKEDFKLMETIYNALDAELSYTVADIVAIVPELAGLNSQKVTPLITKLVNDGKLTTNKEKSRTRYSKVVE